MESNIKRFLNDHQVWSYLASSLETRLRLQGKQPSISIRNLQGFFEEQVSIASLSFGYALPEAEPKVVASLLALSVSGMKPDEVPYEAHNEFARRLRMVKEVIPSLKITK